MGEFTIHGGYHEGLLGDIVHQLPWGHQGGTSRITANYSLTLRHVKAYCFNVIMFALLIPSVIGLSLDVIFKYFFLFREVSGR